MVTSIDISSELKQCYGETWKVMMQTYYTAIHLLRFLSIEEHYKLTGLLGNEHFQEFRILAIVAIKISVLLFLETWIEIR